MSDVIQSVPDTQNNLPRLYKDISGNDSYFAQVMAVESVAAPAKIGVSQSGSVNGTGGQVVVPGGVFSSQVTVQNTDPLNVLYLSFNTPATTNDIELLPTASYTFPFGLANSLYGLSNSGTTKFAAIGS